MNVYCEVNGALADWVTDAAELEVTEGDYFGSGRAQPAGYGYSATDHHWKIDGPLQ